jgi:hypothetical protein
MSAHIKNTEQAKINNLLLHLKVLGKQEQAKPKTSRRRQIIKIVGFRRSKGAHFLSYVEYRPNTNTAIL